VHRKTVRVEEGGGFILITSRLPVFLCLLSLLAMAQFGCKRDSAAHADGVHRVVSLSPSTTEAIAAIGARDELVGRSRYCDYPPDVRSLPSVGGFVDPNFEAIVALRPDLVTGARGPAGRQVTERLEALGIATYFPETESLANIDAMILGLGGRTGHAGEASTVVDALHAKEASLRARVDSLPHPRTLLVFGLGPIVAAGPGGFPDEMLRAAGAANVVTEGGAYPTLGVERILALAPDVVLDATMQESKGDERITRDTPGWAELEAVKAGRVVALRDEAILRPGPRVAEGIRTLATAVHAGLELP
jgi:iron complex transport system substrate-binding protein